MNKQSATYIILVILIAVIAINYWPEPKINIEITKAPSNADYFIKKVTIKQFDNNGHLENQLNADKLEHFKNKQISEIVAPQIIISSPQESTWKISAKAGKLNHSNKLIELKNSVIIEQTTPVTIENQKSSVTTATTVLPFPGWLRIWGSPRAAFTSILRTSEKFIFI